MADTTQFELVLPERLLKSEPVEMVVVPCADGDIGVLPDHSPLIATVRPGLIDVHTNGRVGERIFVSGGFCEVTPVRCTVLAEEAVRLDDIDPAATRERIEAARAARDEADTEVERKAAERELATAEAILKVAVTRS